MQALLESRDRQAVSEDVENLVLMDSLECAVM